MGKQSAKTLVCFSCALLLLVMTRESIPSAAEFARKSVGAYSMAAPRQTAAVNNSASTLITLHVKDAPAADVYSEIARQAKLQIAAATGKWPQLPSVSMDVDQQPFWKVIHQLAGQTGMAPSSMSLGQREVRLIYNPNWDKAPSSYDGCALFVANSISFNQNVSYIVQGQTRSSLSLDINTYIDPSIDVLQVIGLRLDEALDENGASLRNNQQSIQSAPGGIIGQRSVRAQLAYSPTIGKRIVRLKGSVQIAQCTKRETWEMGDIQNAKDVARKLPQGTYTVMGLGSHEADSASYYIKVQIEPAANLKYTDPRIRFNTLHDIRLLDASGQAYLTGGGGGGGAGGPLEYTINFRNQGQDGQVLGPPSKFIWEIPVETKELVVPFELDDISLPPIGTVRK
jgi:hypothetical protein